MGGDVRRLPSNVEAERSVLGAMLLNADAVGAGLEVLAEVGEGWEVFYVEAHGEIYEAIREMFMGGARGIDVVTLMDVLVRRGGLEKAGGASYLAELSRCVPTSANVEVYAGIVRDCALLRRVIAAGTRLVGEAYSGEVGVGELVSRAGAEFLRMGLYGRGDGGRRLEELGGDARARFFARQRGEMLGFTTGLVALDRVLGGFRAGELTVLGARPSVGKSGLMLEFGIAAARAGKRVVFQSLEMSDGALYDRAVYAVAGLNGRALARAGTLAARQEAEKFDRAQEELAGLPFWIEEGVGMTPARMLAGARRRKARDGLDLYLLDYLQLLGVDGKVNSRHEGVEAAAVAGAALARECGCAVVVASQLTRAADQGGDGGRPRMFHLRESGGIEAAAHNIILLSRVMEGNRPAVDESGFGQVMLLDVVKQREGPVGEVYAVVDRRTGRWRDVKVEVDGEGRGDKGQGTRDNGQARGDYYRGTEAQRKTGREEGKGALYGREVLAGVEHRWEEDELEF